jgi:hypothetical protein
VIFIQAIPIIFPTKKRINAAVRAYLAESPTALLLYQARKAEKFLKKNYKHFDERFYIENLNKIDAPKDEILKGASKENTFLRKIKKDGNYLNLLHKETATSLKIPPYTLDELLGRVTVDVWLKTVETVGDSYNRIAIAFKDIDFYNEKLKDPRLTRSEREDYKEKLDKSSAVKTKEIKTVINKIEMLNRHTNWLKNLKKIEREKKGTLSKILDIIAETSTGSAVLKSANLFIGGMKLLVYNKINLDDIKTLIKLIDSRPGFRISKILGIKEDYNDLKLHDVSFMDKKNWEKIQKFFGSFEKFRYEAIDEIKEKSKSLVSLKEGQTFCIALSFGYSSVLYEVLSKVCERCLNENRKALVPFIIAIKDGESIGEERLKKELQAAFPELRDELEEKFKIVPLKIIEERPLPFTINKIFVGIECINKDGLLVHPRGEPKVIAKIKDAFQNVLIYAFGESFKVQEFDILDIDFLKLSFYNPERIDKVITDVDIYDKINTSDKFDLTSSIENWKSKVNGSLV